MEIPSLKQCSNLFNGIMNSKWCHYNGKLTAECQYGEMKYIEKCRTTKYRRAIPIIFLYTAYKKMKESVAICHRGETFFKIWALPANNKRTVTEIVKRLWKTHLSPILTTILVPYDEISGPQLSSILFYGKRLVERREWLNIPPLNWNRVKEIVLYYYSGIPEAYSDQRQTSKRKLFEKIVSA